MIIFCHRLRQRCAGCRVCVSCGEHEHTKNIRVRRSRTWLTPPQFYCRLYSSKVQRVWEKHSTICFKNTRKIEASAHRTDDWSRTSFSTHEQTSTTKVYCTSTVKCTVQYSSCTGHSIFSRARLLTYRTVQYSTVLFQNNFPSGR